MNDEPEYLRLLRQRRDERLHRSGTGAGGPEYTPQEQEALRWAREAARGTDLRSIRNLAGARYAALVRLQAASGVKFLSLEGFAAREALLERIKPGATVGEEVLGAYEVRGGRPVKIETAEGGQIALKMGAPRPGANPVSPEKMIRRAAAQAAEREKSRPRDRERRGPGGKR